MISSGISSRRTNAGLPKEPARLCGRSWRRRALDLRSGWGARLAHRVSSVHVERLDLRWFVSGMEIDLEVIKCMGVEILVAVVEAEGRRLLFVGTRSLDDDINPSATKRPKHFTNSRRHALRRARLQLLVLVWYLVRNGGWGINQTRLVVCRMSAQVECQSPVLHSSASVTIHHPTPGPALHLQGPRRDCRSWQAASLRPNLGHLPIVCSVQKMYLECHSNYLRIKASFKTTAVSSLHTVLCPVIGSVSAASLSRSSQVKPRDSEPHCRPDAATRLIVDTLADC